MISDLKLADSDFSAVNVKSLPDNPSASGISAAQLKATFDHVAEKLIAVRLNGLIDGLVGAGGAGEVGTVAISGLVSMTVQGVLEDLKAYIDAHMALVNNPHDVTKEHVGLGKCDDTSDMNKPVSVDQLAALALKVDKATGKSLISDELITKLMNIEAGAEVNVQSDWNAVSGDSFIQNKPTSMPPAAHKTNHATGGSDALTANDIGALALNQLVQTLTGNGDDVPSVIAVANAIQSAGGGDMIKAIYDTAGKNIDIFAYTDQRSSAVKQALELHKTDQTNPHGITTDQIGTYPQAEIDRKAFDFDNLVNFKGFTYNYTKQTTADSKIITEYIKNSLTDEVYATRTNTKSSDTWTIRTVCSALNVDTTEAWIKVDGLWKCAITPQIGDNAVSVLLETAQEQAKGYHVEIEKRREAITNATNDANQALANDVIIIEV